MIVKYTASLEAILTTGRPMYSRIVFSVTPPARHDFATQINLCFPRNIFKQAIGDTGMKIDAKLIKEVRETADWLINFPSKLVEMIMKPREEYFDRRERIARLKELVELREIGKEIQRLYISKGSIVHWIGELQSGGLNGDAKSVRELFSEVELSAGRIKQVVSESAFSNTSLGAEAAQYLSRIELAYQKLAALPDEELMKDAVVQEIAGLMERMEQGGTILVKELDKHRKLLDHTYGN